MNRNNLILGTIDGSKVDELRYFVSSLKKIGLLDNLVLFASNISFLTKEYLRENMVTVIPVEKKASLQNRRVAAWIFRLMQSVGINKILNKQSSYVQKYWHCQTSRYFHYHQYLLDSYQLYERIMISDVTDVYFQDNPFNYCKENAIYCFEEDDGNKIQDDYFNHMWINQYLGRKKARLLENEKILCSGIVIGDSRSMIQYLARMILLLSTSSGHRGIDQGVHNYLIRVCKELPVVVCKNENGPVYTMGLVPSSRFVYAENGCLLNKNGKPYSILHQYNRHPALIRHLSNTHVIC